MPTKFIINKKFLDFLCFTFFVVAGLVIYSPSLKLGFVSDDFLVFKRLLIDKELWIKGFFRPLGDVTLLFNYLTSGFNPYTFHLTNILIHGINAYLVYCLCNKFTATPERGKFFFAFVAGFLFLTYPFHSESVMWVIGRGIEISTTFGLLSLFAYHKYKGKTQLFLSGFFYFIGLFSFENIMLIPVVIAISELINKRVHKIGVLAVCFGSIFFIHLFLRYVFSGAVWGSYGGKMFGFSIVEYSLKYLKSFGRLMLPPMEKTTVAIYAAIVLFSLTGLLVIYIMKNKEVRLELKKNLAAIILSLVVCMILPGMFGISTHTSEGGRLLYFPSIFYCVLLAVLLVGFIKKMKIKLLVLALLTVYNLFFLNRIQDNWQIASSKVDLIKKEISRFNGKKVFVINLPGEQDGAYIFRNGFAEASIIWGLNVEIRVANILNHKQLSESKEAIKPSIEGSLLHIPPVTSVSITDSIYRVFSSSRELFVNKNEWQMIYWDKKNFKEL